MKGLFLFLDAVPTLEAVSAGSEYSFGGQFLKMVLTLTAFVALLVLVAWLYRKLGLKKTLFGNNHCQIQILERRPLSQKSALYLIEIEGRRMVIGDSQAGPRCVAELTEGPEPQPSFSDVLERKVPS